MLSVFKKFHLFLICGHNRLTRTAMDSRGEHSARWVGCNAYCDQCHATVEITRVKF